MTLFHLREFWTTTCGNEEEEFDKGSICITNIDNSSDGFDKIVVGSFNGVLRIYKVESNSDSKNEQNLFQISDLLLEVDFKIPILQIASGYLLTSNNNQLAILHPNKLSVYSISSTSGVTDHGTSYNILLIYELKFDNEPKAANMLIGSLGQTKGKDIICLQNIDSKFKFYENESFSFGYAWNKSPGSKKCPPMEFTFIPNRDLIVLVDELYQIKCYQYQELAMNSTTKITEVITTEDSNQKECVCDWVYNFGEFVIGMQTVQMEQKWFIVILGLKNLCVLHENGSLFFVKKFDINPSAFCAFANDNRDSLIILIGTQMCNMLVYQNDILRWATKIPFVPVCIERANLNDITGSIVLLSDQGHLTVGYLGTNPSLKIISMPAVDDYNSSNNEKIEEELQQFKKIINIENNQQTERQANMAEYLQINLLDFAEKANSNQFMMVIEILSLKSILNVKFLIHQNDFYETLPNEHSFQNLYDTVRIELQIRFKLNLQMLPLKNKIKCSFMFTSNDNVLRIVNKPISLPFGQLIKLTNPISSSKSIHKYWLKINVQCNAKTENGESHSQMALLFDHVKDHLAHSTNPNGFSFCYNNYEQIQTSCKLVQMDQSSLFQLESNDQAGLYVLLKEFFHRLKMKFPNYRILSLVMNFNPMEQLCVNIRNRVDNKCKLLKFKNELAKFSQHHRVLQKRILVKSKDKTPASLDNLEKLLTLIQKRININIDQIMFHDRMIQIRNYHLWVNLNMLKILLKKTRKPYTKSAENQTLERFIKLISIGQIINFTMDWEELFQASIHEIFHLDKDLGNVVKIMEPTLNMTKQQHTNKQSSITNKNYEHLTAILQENVFKKFISNDLVPIEFL